MRAGRMRHRITIERKTGTTRDTFNQTVENWVAIATRISARVRDDSQREVTAQLQVQSPKIRHVEIRDIRQEIKTVDRVRWHALGGDKIFDIKEVLAGENAKRDITLMCTEHS